MFDDACVLGMLAGRNIIPDDHQRTAITALAALLALPPRRLWFGRRMAPAGVYCYGPPGRALL